MSSNSLRLGNSFSNAQNAFVTLYGMIDSQGIDYGNNTKALLNVGFYLENPMENTINVEWRKWSNKYADREWNWYMLEDRSVLELQKHADIWKQMHNGSGIVNSNYGYQWNRNGQLEECIQQLKTEPSSRQAWLSIFDGKEKELFTYDTPCTMSIGFSIIEGVVCMNVNMRSNDIWYGFCNDQYCFSKLQEYVAHRLGLPVGWYYHNVANLHLYRGQYGLQDKYYRENVVEDFDTFDDGDS